MSDANIRINQSVDTSGTSCPLPVLKTKKALSKMLSGQVLEVISTDPHSVPDIRVFISQTGHSLLSVREENGKFFFLIARK